MMSWPGRLLLAWMTLLGHGARVAHAQADLPVELIPVDRAEDKTSFLSENGAYLNCSIWWVCSWPVLGSHTNAADYTVVSLPDLGVARIDRWIQRNPGPGGRFECVIGTTGSQGANSEAASCDDTFSRFRAVTWPDYAAQVRRGPPQARFAYEPSTATPGRVLFTSQSTDPEDQPLTSRWEFGDGTFASGDSPSHTYDLPGRFTASLTVTDTDGLTNRASQTLTFEAPSLQTSIELITKNGRNRVEPDEVFQVIVRVHASREGVGDLSALAFSGPGPALAMPTNLFAVVTAPADLAIGSLLPGETSRPYEWTLRAIGAGAFDLQSAPVNGQDAAGRGISAPSATASGSITALIVDIQQHPSRVALGADNNGDGSIDESDRAVEIVVRATNVSRRDIQDVQVAILGEPVQLTSLAEDLNIWLEPVRIASGVFGTLRPGAENAVSLTNVYTATGRTYARASSLLLGSTDGTPVRGYGEAIVQTGGEKLVEARFDVEPRPYRSGQPIRVFGSLKNVSRFRTDTGALIDEGKTVGVMIYPTIEGNGALGFCFRSDSGGATPSGPTGFLLEPGETVDLAAIIPTEEVTVASKMRVVYEVQGLVHDEDGAEPRPAGPAEIEIVEDSLEGWSARHTVDLAGVPVVTDPWLVCPTELSFGGFVSCRFTEGLGNAAGSLKDLGLLVGTGLGEIGVGAYRLAGWGFWAVEQAVDALQGDKAARARLASEIADDWNALAQVGVQAARGTKATAASIIPSLDRAIGRTLTTLRSGDMKAIAGGMAETLGENIDVPLEAFVAARAARKAMLLREGAESAAKEALQRSFDRQAAELAGNVEEFAARNSLSELPTSDVLPIGLNVLAHPRIFRDAYGALESEVKALLKIAREEGVIIAFRSRAPRAAELIRAGTHLLKPHGVGIKTVNEIDMKYLGYPRRFEAECVLVDPPIPWVHPSEAHYQDVIDAYLNRFPDLVGADDVSRHLRAQVEDRLKFQLKQYPKQLTEFRRYRREGIDIDFHVQKQDTGKVGELLLPNRKLNRGAQVELYSFADPYSGELRRARRLLMEDGFRSGVFKPITGDIDLLAILTLDGKLPSLAQRIRIYAKLIREGAQHGESFSFFIKELREGWLRCCTPKVRGGEGERMLAATPYGQLLTTQFVDDLSVIEGGVNNALKVGEGEFAFLAGTMSEVYSAERIASFVPDALRHQVAPMVTVRALAEAAEELDADIERTSGRPIRLGQDGRPQVYVPPPDSEPGSLAFRALSSGTGRRSPARPNAPAGLRSPRGLPGAGTPVDEIDATFEEDLAALAGLGWVEEREASAPGALGGQWIPVAAEDIHADVPGDRLPLAPYTYVTEDSPEGATTLAVMTPIEIGAPDSTPIFAIGDEVVLDPGGVDEEFATLVGIQPMVLNHPLQHPKVLGTMVLLVKAAGDPSQRPGALPAPENLVVWLRSDAGVRVDGTNVVSWSDQSRNRFAFQPPEPSGVRPPSWVEGVANGLPAVHFSRSTAPQSLIGDLGRSLDAATIFTLCRFTDEGSSLVYAFGTRNFSGLMMTLGRQTGQVARHFDGAANQVSANGAVPTSQFVVFSQVYGEDGPDHHRLFLNSRSLIDSRTTTGRAYSAVATNLVLGNDLVPSGAYFDGDLIEWLVYDRALSADERFEVEEYLRQRAGLAPWVAPGSLDLTGSSVVDFSRPGLPPSQWSLDGANREVRVVASTGPSMRLLPLGLSGGGLRLRFQAGEGPGALGVVFGYLDSGVFQLLDWRANEVDDPGLGSAPRGLRLRSFHLPPGTQPNAADFWSGGDAARVTTWRISDLPWEPGIEYECRIQVDALGAHIEVSSDDATLISWTIPELAGVSGRFGMYDDQLANTTFGAVTAPGMSPVITGIEPSSKGGWTLRWANGLAPFVVEGRSDLSDGVWVPVGPVTPNQSQTVAPSSPSVLFRVRSSGLVP